MLFFVGLHHPSDAHRFARCCISINSLTRRQKPLGSPAVLLDSGAFSEISRHGGYRTSVAAHAAAVRRLLPVANIAAVVAQDYMCEPFILRRTGQTTAEHQRLTIERYDGLVAEQLPVPLMAVLQGWTPDDYGRHVAAYGDRLGVAAWVGVGSVCRRNSHPEVTAAILERILRERPDLRLHGFGIKWTALSHSGIRQMLYSSDSMAWSFAARYEGRDGNDWREAADFQRKVEAAAELAAAPWQRSLAL